MIYFGNSITVTSKYGIFFKKRMYKVTFDKVIPHFFIIVRIGFKSYWIGMNRFKRICKDKVYELDGVRYSINEKGKYIKNG